MDPISLSAVTAAIAAGATASVKDTASAAVKDAYAGLKALIVRKYHSADLNAVEKKPESEAKRSSLEEDLADAGAADDPELLTLARQLADALEAHDPDAGASIGVDLAQVKAAFLRVGSVHAEGTGVRVREGEFPQGIDIGSVHAGRTDAPAPRKEGDTPDPR